jgi:hypothetical protein
MPRTRITLAAFLRRGKFDYSHVVVCTYQWLIDFAY